MRAGRTNAGIVFLAELEEVTAFATAFKAACGMRIHEERQVSNQNCCSSADQANSFWHYLQRSHTFTYHVRGMTE